MIGICWVASTQSTRTGELRGEAYTWGPVHGYGTPAWLDGANAYDIMPTLNFQQNAFDEMTKILPYQLWNDVEHFKVTRRACYACQLGCHKYVYIGDTEVGELEYETISALGPRCGVSDYKDIALANYYTALYGIDTISAGGTVSAAMEWYEKGILCPEDVDGLDLHFGNGKAMAELVRKMGLREGCGDLFADGSAAAAKRIGKNARDYTMTVKDMEISASDPRGACHMQPYSATIDAFGYILADLGITEPRNPFDAAEEKVWLKAVKEYMEVYFSFSSSH